MSEGDAERIQERRALPALKLFFAGLAAALGTLPAIAEEPDAASRTMIQSELRAELSVPGSLSIIHVDVTKPTDSGLQTACGWFVARDAAGRILQPKAFAMSFSTSAKLAKIHAMGADPAQVQTIRVFCEEMGIDF